jgi:hypothetical protein
LTGTGEPGTLYSGKLIELLGIRAGGGGIEG